MKHLDEFIVERRNFKDYIKYNDHLKNKISKFTKIDDLKVFNDRGENIIDMITESNVINSNFIDWINHEFKRPYFKIYPKNKYQLEIMIYDISKEYLDKLDVEMNIKKYNL